MDLKSKKGKNHTPKTLNKTESSSSKSHHIFMRTSPNIFNFCKNPSSLNKYENKSKNFFKLPPLKSIFFNDIITNTSKQHTITHPGLQKTLLDNRIFLNQQKKELQDLKIQCDKLSVENKNIQNILKKVICIEDMNITTDELIYKIKKTQISNTQYNELKETLKIAELRSEINRNRKILLSKKNEYKHLKNNSTIRNINELFTEISNKEIEITNLKNSIEKLNETFEKNNQTVSELTKSLETQSKNLESLNGKQNENENKSKTLRNHINFLKQQIKSSESNINIQKFKNLNKTNNNQSIKKDISRKEMKILEINEYRKKKDIMVSQISKKQTIIKDLKEKNSILENEVNNLMSENREIYSKIKKYKEESKKLENKSHEPMKEIKKMEQLQKSLAFLKDEKNNLLIINKNYNEKNKGKDDKIKEYKEQKEKLKIQENEFETKLNEVNDEIEKIKENIKIKKSDYDKLIEEIKIKNKKILKSKEKDNKDNKKVEKKRKKEIDDLKSKKEKLLNGNEELTKNNKKLNKEIEKVDNEIKKYVGANDRLIDTQFKEFRK